MSDTDRPDDLDRPGSETLGSAGDKHKMTLFRDDRQEDIGAIVLCIVLVLLVILLTT
jgi:hypothetical protein